MFRAFATVLFLFVLSLALFGQSSIQTAPGAPPNPNSGVKPSPPSPATPADAPFPDRGTIPEHRKASRVKRAVKDVAPNCLDWLLHTCWSQPLGTELNAPGYAHDMEIGNFNFKEKNYRGAEFRFRSALNAVPNDPEASFKLAKSLEKLGRPNEAREQYKAFLQHSSGSPFAKEAQRALERLDAALGKKQ